MNGMNPATTAMGAEKARTVSISELTPIRPESLSGTAPVAGCVVAGGLATGVLSLISGASR
ncbi:hypothetical protein GCM10017786_01880 [Amycolatopsis deserti]|uniref:Uncharacterized protein n=1 Tax=Amycolatopsis deserti TaxID=185696 RepID=A0ABQ3IDT8_9PSEU|nr:hypothetical protein GCM10017786_01880 [Amycolatopsis deserti]